MGDSSGLVLPFFSTGSDNITLNDNSISNNCPIQCPDPTLARNILNQLLPCISCGVGNGSVNYECAPCPVNAFSTAGVCESCPIYSNQLETGQNHCQCFSRSRVDDSNIERCNNEVWGIIIAGIYLLVLGAIVYFRSRPVKPIKVYDRLE